MGEHRVYGDESGETANGFSVRDYLGYLKQRA